MEEINCERILNRIILGRTRIKLGDLSILVVEPSPEIIEESFEIYEEAKKKAYLSGVYIGSEVKEVLVYNELWSPFDDRSVDEMRESIEQLKVHAFERYSEKNALSEIKASIKSLEKSMIETASKRHQLDHLTCEGVANFTRRAWILKNTAKNLDGTDFEFTNITPSKVLEIYSSYAITQAEFREVARYGKWRSMWSVSKKRSNVFGKHPCEMTDDQLSLASYSQMYDNVYESPDCPDDKVIEDDDCLDGWFIVQKKKSDEAKKESEADNIISNDKIANSQEIFMMAKNDEQAKRIYGLNNQQGINTIKQRKEYIDSNSGNAKDHINFKNLPDVSQERAMLATNTAIDATRRK